MTCPVCARRMARSADVCECGHSSYATSGAKFQLFGTTFEGERIVRSPVTEDARKHLLRSIAVAAVSPVAIALLLALNDEPWRITLGWSIASVYLGWATYWGTVAVLRAMTSFVEAGRPAKVGFRAMESLTTHHLGIYGLIIVPLLLGGIYGVLGGGIVEFLRQRKLAHPTVR